jgi:N-acetylmuramoyl-L-alanine amidase
MTIIDRTAETATTLQTRNGRSIFSHGNPREEMPAASGRTSARSTSSSLEVYGTAAARPEYIQLRAGRELVDYLRARHGISRIFGHAHFTQKPCPGPHIWYNIGLWGIRKGLLCDRATRPVPPDWSDPALRILPV